MTQNLIFRSRLNALIDTRIKDRCYLSSLLQERQESIDCGVKPFGSDAAIAHRLRLLGGMAASW